MNYLWTINQIKSNKMINIDQQIADEMDRLVPDALYLQTLRKMKESAILRFEDFSETGRFIDSHTFSTRNPSVVLHPECTDVIIYLCGFYIQSLKGNLFFISMKETSQESDEIDRWTFSNEQLDEVEKVLWNSRANKFFNG